jgi:hypothetical protein
VSSVVVDDVIAVAEPIYSDTDTLQDGRDIDWADWYWAQGPPIPDNDQEFLPASVSPDEADTTDFADYGFSADPLSGDNNPEVATAAVALDDQDFTDTADYGTTVDQAIPDNDQEFLPASVSPDEADTTDTADYGTQSDPLSDDAAAPTEDFLLGVSEHEDDWTDFAEYGWQTDQAIDDNNPEVAPSALDDQDFTDLADYGDAVAPLSGDNNPEVAPSALDEQDFTDAADYGDTLAPLSDDLSGDFVLGVSPDEYDATDFADYGSQQDAVQGADCVFPEVVDVTTTADATSVASHSVNLPSGIVAGQRIIIFFSPGINTSATYPAGWNLVFNSGAVGARLSAHYRDCDGTEGTSITVTTGVATAAAWAAVRLNNFNPGVAPEPGVASTGTDAAPDSPSLTPAWGSDKTLWISSFGAFATPAETVNSYPANYADNQTYVAATAAGDKGYLALATRSLEAATEDPGAFAISAIDTWRANTVAVRGLCNVTPEDFLLGVSEHEHDWTDHTDYGFSVEPLSDNFVAPQDFLLGISEPEQDYTDHAEYGFAVDPLSADSVAPVEDFLLGISEPEQDYTDHADYGTQSDPLSADNNPGLAPSALDEQDFTDTADYGYATDPLSADAHPGVVVVVTGISINVLIGCYHVYGFAAIPDGSGSWAAVSPASNSWSMVSDGSTSWTPASSATGSWVVMPDGSTVWTDEC